VVAQTTGKALSSRGLEDLTRAILMVAVDN